MKKLSSFAHYFIYCLFCLIIVDVVFYFFFVPDNYDKLLYRTLLLLVLSLFICYLYKKIPFSLKKTNGRVLFASLVIACFVVKLIWTFFYRVAPTVDYATFYNFAERLSQGYFVPDRYVALFPHIFGYSLFLSAFFALFGAHVSIAVLLNVLLSTASMALLYFICQRLGGRLMAVIASVLWIIYPNQSLSNVLVFSEPLYTTTLLGIWALLLVLNQKLALIGKLRLILLSAGLLLLLVFLNMCRPVAAIPLIILFAWLFMLKPDYLKNKSLLMRKIACFAIVIIGYIGASPLVNMYIGSRIGETPATTPGYNIYVGFNQSSMGKWNQEDSEKLFHYSNQEGWSAVDAQKQMMEEAKKRITAGNIDFPSLIQNKLNIFLGHDDLGAYSAGITSQRQKEWLIVLSNAFYYFIMIAAACGAAKAVRNKEKSLLATVPLYFIGLTLAQMLVEVAGRYHYSLTFTLITMAAYALASLKEPVQLKE